MPRLRVSPCKSRNIQYFEPHSMAHVCVLKLAARFSFQYGFRHFHLSLSLISQRYKDSFCDETSVCFLRFFFFVVCSVVVVVDRLYFLISTRRTWFCDETVCFSIFLSSSTECFDDHHLYFYISRRVVCVWGR